MDKKQSEIVNNDIMLADALLRLAVLENILINKGIFSKEEFTEMMSDISNKIISNLMKNKSVEQ